MRTKDKAVIKYQLQAEKDMKTLKSKKNPIGDRMKKYYENPCNHQLIKRTPVIIRIDGKAFHNYTKHFTKPFDINLINNMVKAATHTASEMQGFKLAYVQSDEVSFLLTDYDDINSQAWFDYKINKLCSIVASVFTYWFNKLSQSAQPAYFDARVFNVPREEVANYFLWRAKDWERNSIQMAGQAVFSHEELQNKNNKTILKMLHEANKNWYDLDNIYKFGTFIRSTSGHSNFKYRKDLIFINYDDIKPNYVTIATLVDDFIKDKEKCL